MAGVYLGEKEELWDETGLQTYGSDTESDIKETASSRCWQKSRNIGFSILNIQTQTLCKTLRS